jgi:hypothetical protein
VSAAALAVTFFSDVFASTKREELLDIAALVQRIAETTHDAKDKLPLFKFARFGDRRTKDGSLRSNSNLISVSGILADYDGGEMTIEEAHQRLLAADIRALLYTSPSHCEDLPRWRVGCPLSQEYAPDQHAIFLARLNGVLGGIIAPESWTLSQSYYYGSVKRNPSHRVIEIPGRPIDLRPDLDATAIGKSGSGNGSAPPRPATAADPADISDARLDGLLQSLLARLSEAPDGQKHETLLRIARAIGGYSRLFGLGDEQLVAMMLAALPATVLDWRAAEDTARDGLAYGRAAPLELEDRPRSPKPRAGNGPANDAEGTSHLRHAPTEPTSEPPEGWDEPDPGESTKAEADPSPPELPDLLVLKSDLPLVSQQLRDRLAHHPWLFERGGPARLTCFPPEETRPAEINPLGVEGTAHAAHEVCRPYQVDAHRKRKNVTLPERVAKLYLALNGRWQLRPLHGICGSVLLDNDGAIHAHEGYHPQSGMWCTQAPPLTVPNRPTKAEAADALYRLRAAMRTFTFKGSLLTRIAGIDADVVDIEQPPGLCESAGLSGLLTAVCRASLPLAPGLMINAPSVSGSGAGKGLLARAIIAIAFGIIAKAGTPDTTSRNWKSASAPASCAESRYCCWIISTTRCCVPPNSKAPSPNHSSRCACSARSKCRTCAAPRSSWSPAMDCKHPATPPGASSIPPWNRQ